MLAASWWGKIKTTSQMIMICVVLSGVGGIIGNILAPVLIYVSATLTIISGLDYIIKNIDVLKG